VSVGDKLKGKKKRLDVDEVIKQVLTKSRTARELREAVTSRTGVSVRTYHRHVKKLLRQEVVEASFERRSDGRIVKKYVLCRKQLKIKEEKQLIGQGIVRPIKGLDYRLSRELLELAAWIKREPKGWVEDVRVKEARHCLEEFSSLVPEILPSREDPDAYAFVWSDEAVREFDLEENVSSRFFNLKLVYDAMEADFGEEFSDGIEVFVGAYWTPVIVNRIPIYAQYMRPLQYVGQPIAYRITEEPQSVCIAVCRGADTIRVIHVETRRGKLKKSWVKGMAKQLHAKKICMSGRGSLKDELKRRILLNLRRAFEQHKLWIPGRYVELIEDLCDYGYRKPSNGYVMALALAMNL